MHGKGDRVGTVGQTTVLSPVVLLLAERPRLGVNGRQWLFCTLQGGELSAKHVRQMVKRRAAAKPG